MYYHCRTTTTTNHIYHLFCSKKNFFLIFKILLEAAYTEQHDNLLVDNQNIEEGKAPFVVVEGMVATFVAVVATIVVV